MCKAVAYIQGVSVAASVYSLVAVSLDRYVTELLVLGLLYTREFNTRVPGERMGRQRVGRADARARSRVLPAPFI